MDKFTYGKSKAALNLAEQLQTSLYKRKISSFITNYNKGLTCIGTIKDENIRARLLLLWKAEGLRSVDEDLKMENELIKISLKSVMTGKFRNLYRELNMMLNS